MASLSCFLGLCCVLKLVGGVNNYVLLAASVDDFHNIAKKLVPETLANKLARLASDVSVNRKSHGKIQDSYEYESETEDDFDRDEVVTPRSVSKDLKEPVVAQTSMQVDDWNSRVNFDELVERVKDRLKKEISEKLKERLVKTKGRHKAQSIYGKYGEGNVQSDRKVYDQQEKRHIDRNSKTGKTFDFSNSNYPIYEISAKTIKKHGYEELKAQSYPHQNTKFDREPYKKNTNMKYVGNNEQQYHLEDNYDNPNTNLNNKLNKNPNFSIAKYLPKINYDEKNKPFVVESTKEYRFIDSSKRLKNKDVKEKYILSYDDTSKYIGKNINKNKFNDRDVSESVQVNYPPKQVNADNHKLIASDNNKPSVYNEFDLSPKMKNDSYEDYVIPKKAQNIFASDENTNINKRKPPTIVDTSLINKNYNSRFKIKHNAAADIVRPLINEAENLHKSVKLTDDYTEITDKSVEVKAQTESLWFDYGDNIEQQPQQVGNRNDFKDTEIISNIPSSSKKSKPKGTMIPTREYFKMSSPNYYISIPTIAEKFDSSEPLPEKDRERVVIKDFVNPPARINKKVRLI